MSCEKVSIQMGLLKERYNNGQIVSQQYRLFHLGIINPFTQSPASLSSSFLPASTNRFTAKQTPNKQSHYTMLHLTRQLLTQSFLHLGYSPLDYMSIEQIQKCLFQLNQQPFDPQTLEELQNQCTTNSKGQLKLDDLVATFIKAENILVQRDLQIKRMVTRLQKELQEMQRINPNNFQIPRLEEELYQIKEQEVANNINLQIIRKPFTSKHALSSQRSPHRSALQASSSPYRSGHQALPSQYASVSLPGQGLFTIANTHTFTWILQLSVLLLVILLPCMYYVPCFMTVMLLLLIVLNMVSGYFCKFIIRVWMGLVGVSIIIDIIWYIVGIIPFWGQTSDFTGSIHPYLRFTVILYGVAVLGKLILFILLASQYNTDQSEKKTVSVFGFVEVELSHDQVTKNFFAVLNKGESHDIVQDRIN